MHQPVLAQRFYQGATRKCGDFNSQGIANTLWAFGKVGRDDTKVYYALADAALMKLSSYNEQDEDLSAPRHLLLARLSQEAEQPGSIH